MRIANSGLAGFPKWQIALLIGTPVAISLGYYLYRNQSTVSSDKKGKNNLKTKSISIDGDVKQKHEKPTEPTPLEEAQSFKNDGNQSYRKGKFDEAINFYDKAIERCPPEFKTDLAILYQNRAAAYEMLGQWKQVKLDCTKSLEYNPRYVKAYFRRAKANEQTKDLSNALDDITSTCILEVFQNSSSMLMADRIVKESGRIDAAELLKHLQPSLPSKHYIRTYFRSFVEDPLIVGYQMDENIKNLPLDQLKGYARAQLALKQQNYDEIIPACTEEIESSESESQYKVEATLLRGTMHLLSTMTNEARSDLNSVIENGEADVNLRVNALLKRAALNIQTEEQIDAGIADYDEAEKLSPNSPDVYLQRAQVLIMQEKLVEALEQLDKVVKLAPSFGMAQIHRCYVAYRLAILSQDHIQMLAVLNEFKNLVEKHSDEPESYSLMAQVLTDQQQYAQADSFFEKAIKMSPENATLYVHRGIMYLQWQADVGKAVELMEKAIAVDNKCNLAYETLGTIEVQKGNIDRAIEVFEAAIKFTKAKVELSQVCALRNAAVAQKNAIKNLGIDAKLASVFSGSV